MRAVRSILLGRREPPRGSRPHLGARRALCAVACVLAVCGSRTLAGAEPVHVRFAERAMHARLVLRTLDGKVLADGEWNQTVESAGVRSRVVFHFKDGSLHDESVLFTQDGQFRVLSDHLVQTGPAFPCNLDLTIDRQAGTTTVACRDRDGRETRLNERLDLPADLANGIVPTLLKNVVPGAAPRSLSLLVATPRPRVVRLVLSPPRRERLPAAHPDAPWVSHFTLRVEIGGLEGRLAPLVGRQPPDSQVWITNGDPPAYVRSDQPLFVGGPLWRIDVISDR